MPQFLYVLRGGNTEGATKMRGIVSAKPLVDIMDAVNTAGVVLPVTPQKLEFAFRVYQLRPVIKILSQILGRGDGLKDRSGGTISKKHIDEMTRPELIEQARTFGDRPREFNKLNVDALREYILGKRRNPLSGMTDKGYKVETLFEIDITEAKAIIASLLLGMSADPADAI